MSAHILSDRLTAYLQSWHKTSTKKQVDAGHVVKLPFDDFMSLFNKDQLKTLQDAIDANRLRYLQDAKNEFAFVLTWASYAARSSGQFNKDTAMICSRLKSRTVNFVEKGSNLRPSHAEKISKSLTGKPKDEDHKKNIGNANRGKPKAAWDDERKAARRKLIADKKATEAEARRPVESAAWEKARADKGDA